MDSFHHKQVETLVSGLLQEDMGLRTRNIERLKRLMSKWRVELTDMPDYQTYQTIARGKTGRYILRLFPLERERAPEEFKPGVIVKCTHDRGWHHPWDTVVIAVLFDDGQMYASSPWHGDWYDSVVEFATVITRRFPESYFET